MYKHIYFIYYMYLLMLLGGQAAIAKTGRASSDTSRRLGYSRSQTVSCIFLALAPCSHDCRAIEIMVLAAIIPTADGELWHGSSAMPAHSVASGRQSSSRLAGKSATGAARAAEEKKAADKYCHFCQVLASAHCRLLGTIWCKHAHAKCKFD